MAKQKSSEKMTVQQVEENYVVQMNLTFGEFVALRNALISYNTVLGKDLRVFLDDAIDRENIDLPWT